MDRITKTCTTPPSDDGGVLFLKRCGRWDSWLFRLLTGGFATPRGAADTLLLDETGLEIRCCRRVKRFSWPEIGKARAVHISGRNAVVFHAGGRLRLVRPDDFSVSADWLAAQLNARRWRAITPA
jgi:hypothetical protein